jgi:hypothetical protein
VTLADDPALAMLLAAAFPGGDLHALYAALQSYGAAPHEREAPRVRRAIVLLAAGDPAKVAHYLDVARVDYRDVLAWADAPAPDAATQRAERAAVAALLARWGED